MTFKKRYIMFVCETCYETDRKIIGGKGPFNYHFNTIAKHPSVTHRDTCDICGKMEDVIYCCEYRLMQQEKEQAQK